MKTYDYLIVGAGLFGAVFAREMTKQGKTCVVIEKRSHIGGNIYTRDWNGIAIHEYGAHIFHTSDREIWDYVNALVPFSSYINSPVANYKNELYNLPFNMNTFYQMWGVTTPAQAKEKIAEQISSVFVEHPSNLEEQALSLVGKDVYEKLIKGYTEKQWGRDCKELPAFIIKRLPLRFTFDNNYFNDTYQGIPVGGYTKLVESLLDGITVYTDTEFKEFAIPDVGWDHLYAYATSGAKEPVKWKDHQGNCYKKVLYTGLLDELFDYQAGILEYRSLRFETTYYEQIDNYQGNAVINYTEREIPYTRSIEHRHFEKDNKNMKGTAVTKEYPAVWEPGCEPYYPVNDKRNEELSGIYLEAAAALGSLMPGGRLGLYKYYDMDKDIAAALSLARTQ